jgi:hypothetical protein
VSQKLRKDSFAARLTPAQRDELFVKLAGGLGLDEAARQVHAWTKAEWGGKAPSTQAVSAWFAGARVERRHAAAKEAMLVGMANCPADMDTQTRSAIGQAKYLATLEDLEPRDVVAFAKLDLDERKLALDERKLALDNRVARLSLALERLRIPLERARTGEKSEDLQQQISLALEEIHKLKHGEDAE